MWKLEPKQIYNSQKKTHSLAVLTILALHAQVTPTVYGTLILTNASRFILRFQVVQIE